MDSSNAERAWEAYVGRAGFWTGSDRFAFMAAHASRDAEVAELTRLLAESRARFADSEARTAELEAFREKVFGAARENAFDGEIFYSVAHIDAALAETPSTVLEDRDRENRAIGWDEGSAARDLDDPDLDAHGRIGNPYRGGDTR